MNPEIILHRNLISCKKHGICLRYHCFYFRPREKETRFKKGSEVNFKILSSSEILVFDGSEEEYSEIWITKNPISIEVNLGLVGSHCR